MDAWLKEYWFDPDGASLVTRDVKMGNWPSDNEHNALAMWLFWFLFKPDAFERNTAEYRDVTTLLKLVALGAHKDTTSPTTKSAKVGTRTILLYSRHINLTPPPMAAPAILSFLTLTRKLSGRPGAFDTSGSTTSPLSKHLHEWEAEWERCCSLGQPRFRNLLTGSFIPGSIQGVWDGIFTYTEFTAYAALLSGAPPEILQNALVAQHSQTWKLREYHLTSASAALFVPADISKKVATSPLGGGDPLKAYFPDGTQIFDRTSAIEVREPGRLESLFYRRAEIVGIASALPSEDQSPSAEDVIDVIIIGEGHSAWGEFNLLGRVRPCDGRMETVASGCTEVFWSGMPMVA
ncbi:hypothetical protein HWV62_30989 [Athelia sp. TMB]|nr:hypothetical protein HWV62_30989 [Athelia sp. TMB]